MAIGNEVKIDRAWKLALDRALTSTAKEFYEEQYSTGRTVHADDIWKEAVDPDPAQAVSDGVAQAYQELVLEEDLSVAGKCSFIRSFVSINFCKFNQWPLLCKIKYIEKPNGDK